MRHVTAQFLAALAQPHRVAVEVALFPPGSSESIALEPIEGSVTLDITAANRGSFDLTLADPDLVPTAADSPLVPYGAEVKISRGITYPDGTTELVGLGIFGVESVEVEDTGDSLLIHVSGRDRSARVQDAAFEAPYQVQAGTLFTDAIERIVSDVFPGTQVSGVQSDNETPFLLAWEEGTDRWAVCQDLALGVAADLYYNGDGKLVLRAASDTQPKATFAEGADGVLLEATKDWTREGLFNRIIVTGENSGEGVFRGVATDSDPNSPTFYGPPFGKVPRFESYDFVKSDAQAKNTANMLLARVKGLTQGISFGAVVNPALEPDDVIQITRARAGINETHTLDSVTIPLTATEPMSGSTRLLSAIGGGVVSGNGTGTGNGTTTPTMFTLDLTVEGDGTGTVVADVAPVSATITSGTVTGLTSAEYPEGTVVRLTADPDSSSTLVGWYGFGTGSPVHQVVMNGDRTTRVVINETTSPGPDVLFDDTSIWRTPL